MCTYNDENSTFETDLMWGTTMETYLLAIAHPDSSKDYNSSGYDS